MRTEKEIVADANALARIFYSLLGYQVEPGYRFDEATHPQEVAMWTMAVVAYENIEGTDVEDALNQIEDEAGLPSPQVSETAND
jgi:hypothetical protein